MLWVENDFQKINKMLKKLKLNKKHLDNKTNNYNHNKKIICILKQIDWNQIKGMKLLNL